MVSYGEKYALNRVNGKCEIYGKFQLKSLLRKQKNEKDTIICAGIFEMAFRTETHKRTEISKTSPKDLKDGLKVGKMN